MAIAPISSITRFEDLKQAEVERTSVLGQEDFLELMTAQLMNQDPLQPMENGEFLSQMAQFSTVNGINEMNDSVQSMASSFTAQRLMQASGLIGKSALVEGSFAMLDQEKGLRGAFMLDKASDGTQVVIKDLNGQVVFSQQLGVKFSGTHEFSWDGTLPSGGSADPGEYFVQVQALDNGEPYAPTTLVYSDVNAISTGASGELVLEIAGIGELPFERVYRVGQ